MSDEALRWLSEAEWDLETAEILHKAGRYNAAAFYAHQAAEKACKALLYSIHEAPWGHSVRVLLERYFEARGLRIDELLSYARELDRHYIPARYPNAHPAGTPHEAYDSEASSRAISAAKAIVDFARRSL
ncbi:HEPN domain-containing protein [Thermofilum pendens]|uniref:HEPN domain protein n=1 Tax=Thermofilum pendens (strain DSM 2475 / Hrk 5) TaxID=368408 RepID=A1S0V5_THEPD|nr:HEPN domain-containing protein [Thermofilum pendens]ABL79085.1 HEPN domain protein [Thermofilum pendens Hrk 5]